MTHHYAALTLTSVERLEVSDKLDVLVHRRLFGVDGAPEHVAAKLQLVFRYRDVENMTE